MVMELIMGFIKKKGLGILICLCITIPSWFAGTAVNDTSSVTAAASIITTVALSCGVDSSVFSPVKELSKFFIVLAMAAIGLNTDIVKLIRTGGKPLVMGLCCWIGITAAGLLMQHLLGIW